MKKLWRYALTNDFVKTSPFLQGIVFHNEWLSIVNNTVTVKAGYAWDGCSPAYRLPVVNWWVGVPDGTINADGRPQAYFATLVHDALCQFIAVIPISKLATVALFKTMLIEGGFPEWRATLYAVVVYLYGPQAWRKQENNLTMRNY